METPVVPSVNSSLLQQIPNSTARLAGKIKTVVSKQAREWDEVRRESSTLHFHPTRSLLQVNQNKILLIASDKGTVEVNLAPDSGLNDPQEGQFVEVTGKVTETGDGIKEYSSLRLSDNLGEWL